MLLGLAILLVFANGFFVATEFAIVKIRATRLQALVDEGAPGAPTAMKMVGHRTEAIYRRYAIADEAMLREGAEKLAALHASVSEMPGKVVVLRDTRP